MGKKNRKEPIQAVAAPVEERAAGDISISDPALAEYLGIARTGTLDVSEYSALGITGFYRAVSIIAGTIATLPLKTYKQSDTVKERAASFLDNPAGPYPLTPFAWKELVMLHLLIQGEAFLLHVYNGAGAMVGLWPVHRSAIAKVEWMGADKLFTVDLADGTQKQYTTADMTHVMAITTDGLRGIAPLTLFRQTIKLGLAGEIAATRSFSNGMLLSGIVTPDQDMEEEEAKTIKEGLMAKMAGVENAGDIAVINRSLKFSPWSMSLEDAQFLQSREFQVVEFARMFGVPPHLLGATEKQTSWGTGVAEQNVGLARYTLMPWTSRLEESLSALLMGTKWVEFDYAGLLQGSPKEEIDLLIAQVNAGLLTKDEARAIRNLPPLPKDEQQDQQSNGGDQEDEQSDDTSI